MKSAERPEGRPDVGGRILYEDNHLIAINKLPGEISQADRTGDPCMADGIRAFIKERDAKPGNVFLGLVHRLDRPTSGVMVFAKTSKALARLNETFRGRDCRKVYWAIVEGRPEVPEAELVHWLSRDGERNKSAASNRPGPGLQEARLTYRLAAAGDRYSLLEVEIFTGRHHQIRAQLKAVGMIIKGDLKYGAARSNPGGGIALHAAHLSLPHPVGAEERRLELWADPRRVQPDSLWDRLLPDPWRLHFDVQTATLDPEALRGE